MVSEVRRVFAKVTAVTESDSLPCVGNLFANRMSLPMRLDDSRLKL